MTPEREAEIRRQLPCGHTRDADDDGGCTVCRLREDAEEWRARAEKTEAACAEMRAILQGIHDRDVVIDFAGEIAAALAPDAGRGWMSPERVDALLADLRERARIGACFVSGENQVIARAVDATIRALPLRRDSKEDAR